jgi:hypothetical protein
VEGLQKGSIAITDRPREKARADPGVYPEMLIILYRKDRHIEGGNIFSVEVI